MNYHCKTIILNKSFVHKLFQNQFVCCHSCAAWSRELMDAKGWEQMIFIWQNVFASLSSSLLHLSLFSALEVAKG